jgi:hypothetical protein
MSASVSGLLSCRCGWRAEDDDEDDAAPTVASKERKKVA